jgi:DNA-binding response OmpR family regulator
MVGRVLEQNGFEAVTAKNGQEALLRDLNDQPDLVVLDIMLPDINGVEVCRRMRTRTTKPIIMLTAKDEEVDRVVGLEVGADDYVTKPFSPRELIARVRAQLRRSQEYNRAAEAEEVVEFKDLKVDAARHEVIVRGESVRLTPKEFDLLLLLAKNEGRIMHRDVLMQNVWGYDSTIESRTLDVHIQRLRKKTEKDPSNPEMIVTIPGLGYKFQAETLEATE